MLAVALSRTVRDDPQSSDLRAALTRLNVPVPDAHIPPERTWLIARDGDPEVDMARAAGQRVAIVGSDEFPEFGDIAAALSQTATAAALALRAMIRNLW